MTIATAADGEPYCANLFYSFDRSAGVFVFTTDPATRHGSQMERCPQVAASIVLETRTVGRVEGLQITGEATRVEGEAAELARRSYVGRFPYAALSELTLWQLTPSMIKMTDNRLGFGKKIIWTR